MPTQSPQDSQEQLLRVFEALDPIAVLASVRGDNGQITDFRIELANRAAAALMGLEADAVVGRTVVELYPEHAAGWRFETYRRVVETGVSFMDDLPMLDQSDRPRVFEAHVVQLGDGCILTGVDVTASRQLIHQLRAGIAAQVGAFALLAADRDAGGVIVDFVFVEVNDDACRFLRRERTDLLGRRLREEVSVDKVPGLFESLVAAVETGEPLEFDAVPLPSSRRPEGTRFDLRGARVGDGVAVSWRDDSALAAARRERAVAESDFRLLAENAGDLVLFGDADSVVQWVSPTVTTLLGWAPEQMVGHLTTEFIHPDDLPGREEVVTTTEQGAPMVHEVRMATRDGGYRWLRMTLRPVFDEAGRLVGRVGSASDVQAEVEARVALQASEAQYRVLAENMADVVFEIDLDDRYRWVSPSVTAVLGWTPEALIGRTGAEFIPPDDYERITAAREHPVGGAAVVDEFRFRRADGTEAWMSGRSRAVTDDDGEPLGRVVALRDVGERVASEQRLVESESRYRLLAEHSSDVVAESGADGALRWVSSSVTGLLGWLPADLIGRRVAEILHPDDIDAVAAALAEVGDGRTRTMEARLRTASGEYRWVSAAVTPIFDASGVMVGRIAAWRDVHDAVEAREALAQSEERFRRAMESAPIGMAIVDLDRRFLQVNPALCAMLGRDEDWLCAHRVPDILDPLDNEADLRMRAEVLAGRRDSTIREKRLIRADGSRVWAQHAVAPFHDAAGVPVAYVSQFVNITETVEAREALHFEATHDALTHVGNRADLYERVAALQRRQVRTGTNVAVLFADVDHLKAVNDRWGHGAGDAVLVEVARRISHQVRSDDVVARFGGDEFVIVLPGVHTADDAARVAEKIQTAMAGPVAVGTAEVEVTVSIGIAIGEPGSDAARTLQQVDTALYRAKQSGRARSVVYDPGMDLDAGAVEPSGS